MIIAKLTMFSAGVFTIFVVIKGFSVLIHHEAIKAVYAIFIPLAIGTYYTIEQSADLDNYYLFYYFN